MEISFKKLFMFLLRLWWLFVAVAVLGALGGFMIADMKPETYRVTCQVKVQVENLGGAGENFLDLKNNGITNVLETVKNPSFLEKQFEAAGASKLIGKETGKDVEDYVSVSRLNSSDFLNITCATSELTLSRGIVQSILDNLDGEVERVLGKDYITVVKVYDPREVEEPVNPRLTSALVGAVLLAVILGVALVCFRLLDSRIYDEEEIESRYKAAFLGSLKGGKKS